MPLSHLSTDPAVHDLCVRIARKCVWVIQALLREEERGDAMEAFYEAAREEIEKRPTEAEV